MKSAIVEGSGANESHTAACSEYDECAFACEPSCRVYHERKISLPSLFFMVNVLAIQDLNLRLASEAGDSRVFGEAKSSRKCLH